MRFYAFLLLYLERVLISTGSASLADIHIFIIFFLHLHHILSLSIQNNFKYVFQKKPSLAEVKNISKNSGFHKLKSDRKTDAIKNSKPPKFVEQTLSDICKMETTLCPIIAIWNVFIKFLIHRYNAIQADLGCSDESNFNSSKYFSTDCSI